MTRMIMIHSFRRGVGKSSLIANLAALLAKAGKRVGVIDANFQAPSLHILFAVPEDRIACSLRHVLWQQCEVPQAVHDVTDGIGADGSGRIFLIPGSSSGAECLQDCAASYAAIAALIAALEQWAEDLRLDVLLCDSQSGLNEDTLALMTMADLVAIVMRLDQQDYQGTGILLDVLGKLYVPQGLLLINDVSPSFDLPTVRTRIAETYHYPVAAAIPHSPEILELGSRGILAVRDPESPLTQLLEQISQRLMVK